MIPSKLDTRIGHRHDKMQQDEVKCSELQVEDLFRTKLFPMSDMQPWNKHYERKESFVQMEKK